MLTIDKAVTTLDPDGMGLSTDASTIGLAPGEPWPDFIAVIDAAEQGFMFQQSRRVTDDEGSTNAMVYRTRDGRFGLTVFND